MKLASNVFYIYKGDCNFCSELDYDIDTDLDIKCKPDGFYDIVTINDTIEGGTKVIKFSEYESFLKEIKEITTDKTVIRMIDEVLNGK